MSRSSAVDGNSFDTNTLGRDLRAIRTSRGMTLEALAAQVGKSVGWLSQVFFGAPDAPEREQGRVVRAGARRIIGANDAGLRETLISPDLTDDFEVIHSTFEPGSKRTKPVRRETQEVAYMIAGRIDVWLGDDAFTVAAGDSFRIRNESYRWANPYTEPAMAVWVISPPVY